MWPGVSKSGSPISRCMIGFPWASSALARAATSKAVSVPSLYIRSASLNFIVGLPPFRCLMYASSFQVPNRGRIEALHEGDHEAGGVVEVVSVNHGSSGVDVAGRDADRETGHAAAGQLDAPTVRAARGHAIELVGDPLALGSVDHQVAKLQIGDERAVVDQDHRPFAKLGLGFVLLHTRRVPRDANIERDRHVGLNLVREGGSAPQAHFLLHRGPGVDGVRVVTPRLPERLHGQGAAKAVVPGLGEEHLLVRHDGEGADGHRRIAWTDAHIDSLIFARYPDVDEHVALVHHLLALVGCEDVRRLRAEHAYDIALMRAYGDPLGEHDLLPPAAHSLEPQVAVIIYHRDHEANFVHVPGDQYPGRLLLLDATAGLDADYGAEVIGHHLTQRSQVASHDVAHFVLLPRHAERIGQIPHHLQGF